MRIQWARLSGVLRMNPVDSTAIPRPPSAKPHQNGDIGKVHEYCIVFTGFNLQEQALKDWLKTCCKPVCYIMEWHAIISLKTCHLTLPATAAWKQLKFFLLTSKAPEKEKLKMRKDLSDKEITEIKVSSHSSQFDYGVRRLQPP